MIHIIKAASKISTVTLEFEFQSWDFVFGFPKILKFGLVEFSRIRIFYSVKTQSRSSTHWIRSCCAGKCANRDCCINYFLKFFDLVSNFQRVPVQVSTGFFSFWSAKDPSKFLLFFDPTFPCNTDIIHWLHPKKLRNSKLKISSCHSRREVDNKIIEVFEKKLPLFAFHSSDRWQLLKTAILAPWFVHSFQI